MKRLKFSITISLCLLYCLNLTLYGQFSIRNGHDLNTHGKMRCLLIFAELDCSQASGNQCENANGSSLCGGETASWPAGSLPNNVRQQHQPQRPGCRHHFKRNFENR